MTLSPTGTGVLEHCTGEMYRDVSITMGQSRYNCILIRSNYVHRYAGFQLCYVNVLPYYLFALLFVYTNVFKYHHLTNRHELIHMAGLPRYSLTGRQPRQPMLVRRSACIKQHLDLTEE